MLANFSMNPLLSTFFFLASFSFNPSSGHHPEHGGADLLKRAGYPLNITTLSANAKRESTIECWSLTDTKLTESSQPGIQGALTAPLSKPKALNYFVIPGGFDGGLHVAPAVQFVFLTSGVAVLSLPHSSLTATIKGGPRGLILATDTAGVSDKGHTTRYPGKEATIGLSIPLSLGAGEEIKHVVLHDGPCQ